MYCRSKYGDSKLEKLSEKLMNRLIKDASKPKHASGPVKGKLCKKCAYKDHCGEVPEGQDPEITCEMYKTAKKPKKQDRNWNGNKR
jgi:hypothetical protein